MAARGRSRWIPALLAGGALIATLPAGLRAQSQSAPAAGSAAAAAPATAPATGDLEVIVTYKGDGEVRADREITVFLFSDPDINESSIPVAMDVIEKNGGSIKFTSLPGPVVYLVAVYDEAGNYDRQGPPLPGTPLTIHADEMGHPIGIKVGPGEKVAVEFDGSRRM